MHFKIVFLLKASTLCARFRGTDGKLLAVGMEDGAVSVVEVATKVDKPMCIQLKTLYHTCNATCMRMRQLKYERDKVSRLMMSNTSP